MRLFVAVWPPPAVVEVLARVERPPLPGVRWTTPDQWHVTLRFLGEVGDEERWPAAAVLREAAAGVSPVDVGVGHRLSKFGRDISLVQVAGLRPWADAVGAAFDAAGIGRPSDGREFVGHITVARTVGARGARARPGEPGDVSSLSGLDLPPGRRGWRATELALVRSELTPRGARYETLASFPAGRSLRREPSP